MLDRIFETCDKNLAITESTGTEDLDTGKFCIGCDLSDYPRTRSTVPCRITLGQSCRGLKYPDIVDINCDSSTGI